MKKIVSFILAFFMMIIFVSCSNADLNIDVSDASQKILACFDNTQLSEIDKDKLLYYLSDIDVDSISDFKYYIESSGGFADEVAVFRMNSSKDVQKIKDAVTKRVQQRKNDFKDYNPQELSKIESNIIITKKNYLFFVISSDSAKCSEVINQVIKGE